MTTIDPQEHVPTLLVNQLTWLVRLRWVAGVVVILGTLIDQFWLHVATEHARLLGVGGAILFYNVGFHLLCVGADAPARGFPERAAWAQIGLDLLALALLCLGTGGLFSPLLGFFVLHMVFASLLLRRPDAYAAVGLSAAMLLGGLWLSSRWPRTPATWVAAGCWIALLIGTVHLTNQITRALRRHHDRVLEQNRAIREMSARLRRQQRAMVQHEKMAAMGHMAAGVAHEIANPLASMDGLLQLMARRGGGEQAEAIATLREQVSRINETLKQMTRFARPADEALEIVDLNELVESSLALVRFDHRLRDVEIHRALADGPMSVRGQRRPLEQVLVNLIINAVDALAQTSRPRLTLATGRDGDGRFVSVADNGTGIAPEDLDRLFEPFFTTKPVGRGTGLGLAVSYAIVQQHGGRIEVDNRPGQGATFRVILPDERDRAGSDVSRPREEAGAAVSES